MNNLTKILIIVWRDDKLEVQDDPSVTLHKGAKSKYSLPFVRELPQGGVIYFGVSTYQTGRTEEMKG